MSDYTDRVCTARFEVARLRRNYTEAAQLAQEAIDRREDCALALTTALEELREAIDAFQDAGRKARLNAIAGQLLGAERDGLVELPL